MYIVYEIYLSFSQYTNSPSLKEGDVMYRKDGFIFD